MILVLMFTMLMQVSSYADDPPPPPPNGGNDPTGNGGQIGGGAPVGSGLLILMGLGGCYGGYKLSGGKRKSDQIKHLKFKKNAKINNFAYGSTVYRN